MTTPLAQRIAHGVLRAAGFTMFSAAFGCLLGAATGWAIFVGEGQSPVAFIEGARALGIPRRSILLFGPVPEAPFLGAVVASLLGPVCFFLLLGGRASPREFVLVLLVTVCASMSWGLFFGLSAALMTPVALLAVTTLIRVVREDRVS
jgi:hypothetical protein